MSRIVSDNDLNALRSKLFEALGNGYQVEIHKEVSAKFGLFKEVFDLVIFNQGDAICGIDYKYKIPISMYSIPSIHQQNHIERYKKVGLKYGVVYCGDRENCLFWTQGAYYYKEFTFDNIVKAIRGNQNCGARFTPDEVKTKLFEKLPQNLSKEQVSGIRALINENDLVYDESTASMFLKTEAEDQLFKILLISNNDKHNIKNVCRYTSLYSLFLTIKNGTQVMCSITCMNDKGETSYADKYVGFGAFANTSKSIEENNDCFILSCCNIGMKDNLTMWRLYGDDGKGVCLEYDVDLTKVDEKSFFFAPVSYGEAMRKHPALDFISDIRHWNENGWSFNLKRWYIWKHFFKSHLFKEENEVRLLYLWTPEETDNTEWILDSTNSIVSRICKFPIPNDRLPLTLKNAIIGPKCPEQNSNVDQLNYMNGLKKVMPFNIIKNAIQSSSIEDYR